MTIGSKDVPGPSKKRTDSAARVIKASPQALYRAFVDPAALASWLPPQGMTAEIKEFDPREGGAYRMTLTYREPNYAAQGKASEHSDVVRGTFLELIPDRRIVQAAEFESDDPAFAGVMTLTWSFVPTEDGARVTVVAENVPYGIGKEDHEAGLKSSLENLAAFAEGQPALSA